MSEKRNGSEFGMIFLLLAAAAAGIWFLRHHAATHPAQTGETPGESSSAGAPAGTTGLRAVDFRNFDYQPACLDEGAERRTIHTKNGHYEANAGGEMVSLEIAEVVYGDITGDGEDEAAVLTVCNTGGSGVFTEAVVFALKDGRPVELTRAQEGDRAFGGIAGLKISDGALVVERYASDAEGPACCPKYVDTTHWRWNGTALEQAGSASRREAPVEQEENP